MATGNFLGGFAEAFGEGLRRNQQQQQLVEQRKARKKLFDAQLKMLELKEDAARQRVEGVSAISEALRGRPGAEFTTSPVGAEGTSTVTAEPRQPSVTEVLADPNLLQAFAAAPGTRRALEGVAKSQQDAAKASRFQQMLGALFGGGSTGVQAPPGAGAAPGNAPGLPASPSGLFQGGAAAGGAPGLPASPAGLFGGDLRPELSLTSDGNLSVSFKQRSRSPEARLEQDIVDFSRKFGPNSPEVRALKEARGTFDEPPDFSTVGNARREFSKASADNAKALAAFDNLMVVSRGENVSGAGDIAMIFSFMKLLDPGSRVTEGEVALAGQVSGRATQFLNLYNRLVKGERLSPKSRADFRFQAAAIARQTIEKQRRLEGEFIGIAQRNRVDPRDIVRDFIGNSEALTEGLEMPDRSLSASVSQAEKTLSAATEAVGGVVERAGAAAGDALGQAGVGAAEIATATIEQIADIDFRGMSEEMVDAVLARIAELERELSDGGER